MEAIGCIERISLGGAWLRCYELLELGTLARIRIDLEGRSLVAEARVVQVDGVSHRSRLEFTRMTVGSLALLRWFIDMQIAGSSSATNGLPPGTTFALSQG